MRLPLLITALCSLFPRLHSVVDEQSGPAVLAANSTATVPAQSGNEDGVKIGVVDSAAGLPSAGRAFRHDLDLDASGHAGVQANIVVGGHRSPRFI